MSVVILTVILYCPINHWSRHYEPGLCLFNLELHLSSPAPGPTNVTVLLFAFTIFTVFPTWTVLPASPSYRLVLGLQVNTELHCHCCFPQLFQQWNFHVNIYTSYEHWAMCRRWTGSIVCCVCRLMFVSYFVSWRRTITTDWSPTRNLTGFYTRCKVERTQSCHCQHHNTERSEKRISCYRNA